MHQKRPFFFNLFALGALCALALLMGCATPTYAAPDAPAATPTPKKAAVQPNLFELSGKDIKVTYSLSSFQGKPQLHLEANGNTRDFSGKDIRTQDTEIGTLVTVTLSIVPRRSESLFSLMLPHFGSMGNSMSQSMKTFAVLTQKANGPKGSGQLESYQTVPLSGTAKFVVF